MVICYNKIIPENIIEELKEEIILQFRDVLIDGLKHNIRNLITKITIKQKLKLNNKISRNY